MGKNFTEHVDLPTNRIVTINHDKSIPPKVAGRPVIGVDVKSGEILQGGSALRRLVVGKDRAAISVVPRPCSFD